MGDRASRSINGGFEVTMSLQQAQDLADRLAKGVPGVVFWLGIFESGGFTFPVVVPVGAGRPDETDSMTLVALRSAGESWRLV